MVRIGEKGVASKLFAAAAAATLALTLAATGSAQAYADEATDEVDGYVGYVPSHIQYSGESEINWLNAYVYDNAEWEAADEAEKQAPSCFAVTSSNENVAKVAVVAGESLPGYEGEDAYLRITPVANGTTTITVTYKYKDIVISEKVDTEIIAGAWEQAGNKWKYKFGDEYVAADPDYQQSASLMIKGKRYFFDADGIMRTGWYNDQDEATEAPTWYYLGSDGAVREGWQKIKGAWYYLSYGSGAMKSATTWTDADGYTWGFKPSGALTWGWFNDGTVWNSVEKKYANYTTDENGVKSYIEPEWYYLGSNGAAKVGWNKIKGQWYYLGTWSNPVMRSGYFADSTGTRYVADYNGALKAGWYNFNWHFDGETGKYTSAYTRTDRDGKKVTEYSEPCWYYGNKSGALQSGWNKINGQWYLFGDYDNYRVMLTGWQKVNGAWYYLADSGAMVSSKWVGDYYLTNSGAMATNTWIGKYHVNASGVWDATK